jgi:hypothetical protein
MPSGVVASAVADWGSAAVRLVGAAVRLVGAAVRLVGAAVRLVGAVSVGVVDGDGEVPD